MGIQAETYTRRSRKILLHLWEMQNAELDYYFLDENCSYQLLSLLEIAREDLALTKEFSVQAIPSDTVRVLAENDLLEAPYYRAAFGTRLYIKPMKSMRACLKQQKRQPTVIIQISPNSQIQSKQQY